MKVNQLLEGEVVAFTKKKAEPPMEKAEFAALKKAVLGAMSAAKVPRKSEHIKTIVNSQHVSFDFSYDDIEDRKTRLAAVRQALGNVGKASMPQMWRNGGYGASFVIALPKVLATSDVTALKAAIDAKFKLLEATGDKKFDSMIGKITDKTPKKLGAVGLKKLILPILHDAHVKFKIDDKTLSLASVKQKKLHWTEGGVPQFDAIFHFNRHNSDLEFVHGVQAAEWVLEQLQAMSELGFDSFSTFTGNGGDSFKKNPDKMKLRAALRRAILFDVTFKRHEAS